VRRRGEGSRLRLRFDSLVIEVASEDRAAIAWLEEFLAPAFQVIRRDRKAPDHEVVFRISPAEHADLHCRLESASLKGLEGFTLDGSFTRHRGWRSKGRTWVHAEDHDTFFGVAPRARSVVVVAGSDGGGPRVALMRVVRELATVAMQRLGRLPVHGAAFRHDGRAVLVCGPKRSGKTSLLVHALKCGGAFLSNDRVFVGVDAPPRALPMPTIVMLREGTLDRFGDLRDAYDRARFDRGRTLAECAPGVARPDPRAGKGFDRPGVSPAQLCRLLGAPMRGAAPVGMLLFPRIDRRATGIALTRLSADAARRALARSLLKPSHPTRLSEVFAPGGRRRVVSPAAEAERVRRLVGAVPAYACRLGPDAFEVDLRAVLPRGGSSRLAAVETAGA
jgi:hypothetical protein